VASGRNPEQLLKECRYKARSGADGYLVQPEERYLRRTPDLARTKQVYGLGVTSRLQHLGSLRERIDPPMPEAIGPALEKRKAKAERSQELLDLLNFECLAMYATPVEIDPVLLHRLKLASIWLRIEQDERVGKGDLSHLKGVHEQAEAFGASAGLYSGVYMSDAYVAPLLGALAPGVWGFAVVRSFGCGRDASTDLDPRRE